MTVAAGDLIGATPLLSAAFHDEPAIEALGLAGLDYASVGNHEFDEGAAELLRIQNGGCHPVDGCADPALPYGGADFQYLSANAFVTATGQPLLPPYAIHKVQGVKVGFIGMTLEGTPDIVTPPGVAGLEFRDEAETANRYAAELRRRASRRSSCCCTRAARRPAAAASTAAANLPGPIVDIVPQMYDAIDVVVTGHTHQAYNCVLDGRVVTSASSFGRLVTDIDLRIDPAHRRRARRAGRRQRRGGPRRGPRRRADGAHRPLPDAARPDGRPRRSGETSDGDHAAAAAAASGETPLGNLIADAQLRRDRRRAGRGRRVHEPRRGPGRPRCRARDLRGGVHRPALRQLPDHARPDRRPARLRARAAVRHRADAAALGRRELHRPPGRDAGTAADPCAGTKVEDIVIGGVAGRSRPAPTGSR